MDRRNFIKTSSFMTANAVFLGPILGTDALSSYDTLYHTLKDRDILYASFVNPPLESLAGCYWWWLNGLVNKRGITRDLEEFRNKGINDLLLVNSAGRDMPVGVQFLSEEWKELFRHALTEAKRLNLQIGVNLSSGWCMGGPWITPEIAGRWFLQSETVVEGPGKFSALLPLPGNRSGYDEVFNPPGYKKYLDLPLEQLDYRDTAVVAFPVIDEKLSRIDGERKKTLSAKTNRRDASNHAPAWDIMGPTLDLWQSKPTDTPVNASHVIDLTCKISPEGHLKWDVPPGRWIIVRTGHRMTGSRLSIAQPEADGLSIGWLDSRGVETQFENIGSILLNEAKEVDFQLKFFCDDSFEDGFPNWTASILEYFKHYRGYDALPYLPVLAGYIVENASVSDRFLHDYRKTVADCMADNHYKRFAELCHGNGLLVQNESAGPSRSGTMCMDGLKNLGRSDLPAGEFWLGIKHDEEGGLDLPYGQSRLERGQNKVTKMVASAAHIYGKNLVTAESYTTYRHWMDCPASLKQATDRAFCEGVNRLMIHTSTATRPEDGLPGYEYYAGTHFNPNVTWWDLSTDFLAYIGRCQYLLRKGKFVADVLFYNGDWAPNLVLPKHVEPSLGKGYDYDVCNEEVLLERLSVDNGLITLPDGMRYRLLVLPDTKRMPLPVLQKIEELVEAGATVSGPMPVQDPGLRDYPNCDESLRHLAAKVWGPCDGERCLENHYGKGRVFYGKPLREILLNDKIFPDFETDNASAPIDFIHRSSEEGEFYFVCNQSNVKVQLSCAFRQEGKAPEIWDPVTGKKWAASQSKEKNGRIFISMLLDRFQSFFVVFSNKTNRPSSNALSSLSYFPYARSIEEIEGEWQVCFDTKWGAPSSITFNSLQDWTKHPESSIRYYSGKAIYKKQFFFQGSKEKMNRVFLDLGEVRNIAEVHVNNNNLGVVWTSPWRVEITDVIRKGENWLEITVANLWPNRLIGDASLPEEQRMTKTNIKLKEDTPLLPSGLLGPVSIVIE